MANTIESEEFHNLMRSYRWASEYSASPASRAYQAVIAYIDKDRAERDKRIFVTTAAAVAKAIAEAATSDEVFVSTAYDAIRAITPESVLADIDKKQEIAA